jgi:hypothetical protein
MRFIDSAPSVWKFQAADYDTPSKQVVQRERAVLLTKAFKELRTH